MKLRLFTNVFMFEGKKHMSVSVSVLDDIHCHGVLPIGFYVTEGREYEAAMAVVSLAASTMLMLESMGHEVEIEDELKTITDTVDVLRAEMAK